MYICAALYVWLGAAVASHLPILHYDVKVPVSLFSPLFLCSALALFMAEGALKLLNRWFVFHVGFRQNSLEVLQNSFVVSLGCCLVYSQCGSVTSSGLLRASTSAAPELIDKGIDRMCIVLFSGHVDSRFSHLPMVLVLWCTAMSALVLNFFIERISGYRGMFSDIAAMNKLDSATTTADAMDLPPTAAEARMEASSASSSSSPAPSPPSSEKKRQRLRAKAGPSSSSSSSAPVPAPAPGAGPVSPATPAPSALSKVLSAQSYKSRLAKIRPNLFKDMLNPPYLEMVPWSVNHNTSEQTVMRRRCSAEVFSTRCCCSGLLLVVCAAQVRPHHLVHRCGHVDSLEVVRGPIRHAHFAGRDSQLLPLHPADLDGQQQQQQQRQPPWPRRKLGLHELQLPGWHDSVFLFRRRDELCGEFRADFANWRRRWRSPALQRGPHGRPRRPRGTAHGQRAPRARTSCAPAPPRPTTRIRPLRRR